jgi:sec-independent protein translocase protein TatA
MLSLATFFNLNPMELLIVLGAGILLFGRRLPEVGRSLGRGIVEFKKGLKGIGDEIDEASNVSDRSQSGQQPPASLPRPKPPEAPWTASQQEAPSQRVEEVRVSRSDKVD